MAYRKTGERIRELNFFALRRCDLNLSHTGAIYDITGPERLFGRSEGCEYRRGHRQAARVRGGDRGTVPWRHGHGGSSKLVQIKKGLSGQACDVASDHVELITEKNLARFVR
jgi:hypothetical protein